MEGEGSENEGESQNSGGAAAASSEIIFDRTLFEIPDGLEFPLELNQHLKGKLHSVLQQNWHLKRHMDYLDKEVIELRKYRSEHREKCGREQESDHPNSTTAIMSQRVVELSRKNRDMTAQTEAMKTKISKLLRENDSLRNMVECFKDKDSSEDLSRSYSQLDWEREAPPTTTPGSQQNAQLTNKVIEYRRQNQLLRMELKTALRALSQEVGDGATPHGVLNSVTGNGVPSWRGRQQQIIALQQKVTDLQVKLKDAKCIDVDDNSFQQTHGGGDADTRFGGSMAQGSISVQLSHIPQRATLLHQDKKKYEQIEKLSQDLEQTTKDWKSCQQELKACKARIQTLELNVKTHKSHCEILEEKLNEGEKQAGFHSKEMKTLRQELGAQRERERRYRDQSAIEIQEGQRALQRERSIVIRLQSVIDEKQEVIQKQDAELIDMKTKLEVSCTGKFAGGIDTVDRVRQMESQLEKASKALEAGERERQSLLKMMQDYLNQAEGERKKFIHASEHTARITCVLQRANDCINECLDAGQVTSKEILQEVEHIRTLVRELKLGDLYVYENVQHTDMTTKLKTQVNMLKREVISLKTSLKEVAAIRRKDLENFATVTDRIKGDLDDIIHLKKRTAATPFTPYTLVNNAN